MHKYVCWECWSNVYSSTVGRGISVNGRSVNKKVLLSRPRRIQRYGTFHSVQAEHRLAFDDAQETLPPIELLRSVARDQLRSWESEKRRTHNQRGIVRKQATESLVDSSSSGADAAFDTLRYEEKSSVFSSEDLVDVGDRRRFLRRGDLVEVQTKGKLQLAVYIQAFKGAEFGACYTMDGRGFICSTGDIAFSVHGYFGADDLDCLDRFVPDEENVNESDEFQVPVKAGATLLAEMQNFWRRADEVYRRTASRLEDAHEHLAHETEPTYHTLEKIAAKVLPRKSSTAAYTMYNKPELYAVHRAMLGDELALKPASRLALRNGGQYEVCPRTTVEDLSKIKAFIRQYQEAEVKRIHAPNNVFRTPLHIFASRARAIVDLSRQNRDFTIFGTIGPSIGNAESSTQTKSGSEKFIGNDQVFVRFLKTWTLQTSMSKYSHANGFASIILRAVDRYDGVDLDLSIGWTFLKELGIIAPWEIRAPYALRMPSVVNLLSETTFKADALAGIRKDWKDLPVYCVDDVEAHELDDGVSIEASDARNEYWVHVHTADPAAHLHPESNTANYARSMVTTVYLPHKVFPMLPSDYVQSNLSLKSGRPCLTFSARVNLEGELLETKITPSVIRNVKFLEPSVLEEIISNQTSGTASVYCSVGPKAVPRPKRQMHKKHDLEESDIHNLGRLHQISVARQNQYAAKGGLSFNSADLSLSITFNVPSLGPDSTSGQHQNANISIALPQSDSQVRDTQNSNSSKTVASLMLLAGEVAARWCYRRGIPIPYRVTPRNPELPDAGQYFRNVILPRIHDLSITLAQQYSRLIGHVVSSTIPGPHMNMGAEIMTRCTSPLRRYGDLLVHWQIEAALLEEAKIGRSLIEDTREDFLPFSKEDIEDYLPYLDTQDRLHKAVGKTAKQEWLCHLLVQAWHFKDAELPSPLRLKVLRIDKDICRVKGILAEIPTTVYMMVEPAEIDSIDVEDCFEVELAHIDVHRPRIMVKPVKKLDARRRLIDASPSG